VLFIYIYLYLIAPTAFIVLIGIYLTSNYHGANILNLLSKTCEAYIRAYNKRLSAVACCSNTWENRSNIYIINLEGPKSCPISSYFYFRSLSTKSLIRDGSSLLRILGSHLGIAYLNNAISRTYPIL
jgi:hypothetical protein